jgi:hypothetical protein
MQDVEEDNVRALQRVEKIEVRCLASHPLLFKWAEFFSRRG